ncbi:MULTISPECIES: hypothetical protein [Acinetobacter]|uniref:Uncharacterized protein n=1 Tax=Acinetobacter proteolyticus TaxID=1776741 RepID=A0A653K7Q5_9GAMM|nr:hypothetical protein [Acinetobacter proteolyticus]VXA56065.1 conserved exported hypothetical protein [Acinetobacter proteolyticus]
MKKLKVILTACVFSALSTAAMAKAEQITLKANVHYGEEAVIFPTTKGEVILNSYALPSQVAKQLKPFKKGQCLEIQSKYGFYKDTGDGAYIQSIRPCKKNSQPTASNVKR